MSNEHLETVTGFGDEWSRFNQSNLDNAEKISIFNSYFKIFPWNLVSTSSVGFDMGCGSGRWASLVAPRVGLLHCIDPSSALNVARTNLNDQKNCIFHQGGVGDNPLPDGSMDFGYSLGVLHHVPNTALGIKDCARLLKPGAPLLIYLYYALDNRPIWFRIMWKCSDQLRLIISRLPYRYRYFSSQIIAFVIYFPLARFAWLMQLVRTNIGLIEKFPLAAYRNLSFYTMRTDALDRFGTQLEQRFTKKEITKMMQDAGLKKILFSDSMPFWCAVGIREE